MDANNKRDVKDGSRRLAAKRWAIALWLSLGAALGLAGCASRGSAGASADQAPQGAGAGLELNEGRKWTVAPPMMAHLRALEKAVQDFEATPQKDHAALAAKVEESLGRLVTNCTMEGRAHDELHKWLMPFLGASAEYSRATTPEVQQAKLEELKRSLVVFNAYFE